MLASAFEPARRPGQWRRISRVLLTVVILYLLVALVVAVFQRGLIYFPSRLEPSVAAQLAAEEGFQPWRNAAGEVIGWHLAADGPSRGWVLIAHGNAGCAVDRGYLTRPIHAATPVDVLVLEYPGYGARAGSPSQRAILAAADEAFALIPDGAPIYAVSESLGAGVAAHLAGRHGDRVAGLVLLAPYDNLVSVGQRRMPFLPVSWLLRDRFDPAQWLKDYRGPMVVVLAEADRIIPTDLGRRLYDGYAGPKRLQVMAGAGHNDVAVQSPEWWEEAFSFCRQNRPTSATAR